MVNLEFCQPITFGDTAVFATAACPFANRADLLSRDCHLFSFRSLSLVFAFNIAII